MIHEENQSNIRVALIARRAELIDRSLLVERDLERKNDALSADFADQAVQRQNDEVLAAIGAAAREEIVAVDSALRRLDANLYGICKRCGKAISDARLAAAPYATDCLDCNGG